MHEAGLNALETFLHFFKFQKVSYSPGPGHQLELFLKLPSEKSKHT